MPRSITQTECATRCRRTFAPGRCGFFYQSRSEGSQVCIRLPDATCNIRDRNLNTRRTEQSQGHPFSSGTGLSFVVWITGAALETIYRRYVLPIARTRDSIPFRMQYYVMSPTVQITRISDLIVSPVQGNEALRETECERLCSRA